MNTIKRLCNSQNISKLKIKDGVNKFVRNVHQYYSKPNISYPIREFYKKNQVMKIKSPVFVAAYNFDTKDYYAVLGLTKDASAEDIKNAYYNLAKKFHPDTKRVDEIPIDKTFREVAEAYNVLSNESKKMEYDLYGTARNFGRSLRAQTAKNHLPLKVSSLNEIFQERLDFKKDSKPDNTPITFNASDCDLSVTFLQAVQGVSKAIELKTKSVCSYCGGILHIESQTTEMCKACKGTGKQLAKQSQILRSICNKCRGRGQTLKKICSACNNTGYILNKSKLSVHIPPGTNNGDVLNILHPDGKQRIKVRVNVQKNKTFKQVGKDIYSETYLSITEAIFGGVFKIKGIYEDFRIKLDGGVDSHTQVRLPGKGIRTKTGVGDHIVEFRVKIPKNLTQQQKESLQALAKIENTKIPESDI